MQRITVKIADIVTEKSPAIIHCVLGSCVAIILCDSEGKIGSLAHAMLPTIKDATGSKGKKLLNPAKYVDSAIDIQLEELRSNGVRKKTITAKLVGGASMFTFEEPSRSDFLNIGARNAEMAIKTLEAKGIPIVGKDLGKDFGRVVHFHVQNGKVIIEKAGKIPWKEL